MQFFQNVHHPTLSLQPPLRKIWIHAWGIVSSYGNGFGIAPKTGRGSYILDVVCDDAPGADA